MTRKCNQAGINIICESEELYLKAYLCPKGIPTIGYGHTKTVTHEDVKNGRIITENEADRLFLQDVMDACKDVETLVKVRLNDNQFSALVSLVFNIGEGQFKNSTMLRKLNQSNYPAASAEFKRWKYCKGKVLAGLVKRRQKEEDLFNA